MLYGWSLEFVWGTTIVVFVICSTICIVLDLVFLSFELTALISIVTWLLQWWHVVWAFQSFVVCLVASQYLVAFHLGLPNHLVPTPFQDATQSVHMCHSPSAPG